MDRFLVFCSGDLIQTFKCDGNGRITRCYYKGEEQFRFSANKNIWEEYWKYVADSENIDNSVFGVSCIYIDFEFKDAFMIMEPLCRKSVLLFQINALETVLPEIMVKKRLLVNQKTVFIRYGTKEWKVSSTSCVDITGENKNSFYKLTADDIALFYFTPLQIGKNEYIQNPVQHAEKSGDIARYVNSSNIDGVS